MSVFRLGLDGTEFDSLGFCIQPFISLYPPANFTLRYSRLICPDGGSPGGTSRHLRLLFKIVPHMPRKVSLQVWYQPPLFAPEILSIVFPLAPWLFPWAIPFLLGRGKRIPTCSITRCERSKRGSILTLTEPESNQERDGPCGRYHNRNQGEHERRVYGIPMARSSTPLTDEEQAPWLHNIDDSSVPFEPG